MSQSNETAARLVYQENRGIITKNYSRQKINRGNMEVQNLKSVFCCGVIKEKRLHT